MSFLGAELLDCEIFGFLASLLESDATSLFLVSTLKLRNLVKAIVV